MIGNTSKIIVPIFITNINFFYFRDISNVPDSEELNDSISFPSPCSSTNSENSNKRQKTITTANGLQICNKTLEELKSTILTRHTERSTFENKLLAKYDDNSEKAEIFR